MSPMWIKPSNWACALTKNQTGNLLVHGTMLSRATPIRAWLALKALAYISLAEVSHMAKFVASDN